MKGEFLLTKITGLIIMSIALLAAIFCLVFGIRVRPDLKRKNSLKTRFLVAVTVIMASITGCFSSDSGATKTPTAIVAENMDTEKVIEDLKEKWGRMKEISEITDPVSNKKAMAKEIKELDNDIKNYIDSLERADYFSPVFHDAVLYIYNATYRKVLAWADNPGDHISSPPNENTTCYLAGPPVWEYRDLYSKEELEKQFSLLKELYEKGNLDKETYDEAKKNIEGKLALLDKAGEYWKDKGEERDQVREDYILVKLYDSNAGGIQEGKEVEEDLIEASKFIVILEKAR